mmetsp:Transcript_3077/g.2641  ORF Transcript_3077/g.2641 Transcript_3077/m.2641 type:complete len:97 (-) Transcript_3077:161-451(-)
MSTLTDGKEKISLILESIALKRAYQALMEKFGRKKKSRKGYLFVVKATEDSEDSMMAENKELEERHKIIKKNFKKEVLPMEQKFEGLRTQLYHQVF